ncbi:MAG TPA: thioredoxin [bacterium]|nr:thioredoxin [Candidatus Omnitrophota bacterium]HOJ60772.1 thioredoxin [bacterium]HOL96112.1 thioredoxin [bacterium]HPP02630.1 thioredoxin [bacterium]
MSHTIEIQGSNFETEVLQSDVPVLVDFSASWCGPCQKIAPWVHELAGEFAGRAKVVTVDVDSNQDLATRYGVMSVPTLMIIKGGEVVNKWIGITSKQVMSDALETAIAS